MLDLQVIAFLYNCIQFLRSAKIISNHLRWFLRIAPRILYCAKKLHIQENERVHSETWYWFSISCRVKTSTMVFCSWTSTVTYIFHCIVLVYKFSAMIRRNLSEGTKISLKACTKPVPRRCKLWSRKQRLEEHSESLPIKIVWFFHKLHTTLFYMLETFYLSGMF